MAKKFHNILLAEDDYSNAEFVKLVLKNSNFSIIHTLNGAQAVEEFRSNPDIDLILMDIKMPVMDGYTATKEIRKINKNIPVIAVTAFALDGDREKALDAGCTDYVTKPISKERLTGVVSFYLSKNLT